tara:strand:- start:471 stop:1922 length:1452 start_codon:yes stop_codon:yes gene_type:complete
MIVRWVCENCNKKWIYPVEKCVFCKGEIKKQLGSKLKVIGITKVTIPSPMHPIIPYNIILLEDEFGNRLPKKTMKEYKIGENYVEEKAKTQDAVSIAKVKYDIYEAIKESMGLLNGVELNSDDKVLVKPSVTMPAYPYQAVNTNPDFLDALLKYLLEKGVKKGNIVVAEQSLIGSSVESAAAKAGIMGICKKNGVNMADISKGPFEEVESNGFKFKVYKEALHRKVINAPIMKTNFQIGISGALENLSRLVDVETQIAMYNEDIDITLPKLIKVLPDVLTIADATNGMQSQGPLALGEPAFLNLVFSSKNPAVIDTAFCEVTMLPIPHHVSNSGNLDVKKIEVVGNELESLKYPINHPEPDVSPHPDIKVIDGRADPRCLSIMYTITSKLIGLRGEQINIVMGSNITEDMVKDKERLVVLGNAANKKLQELKRESLATIDENIDSVEQILLLKKLLTTKGKPSITPVDKVKSKMKNLLSKVAQ